MSNKVSAFLSRVVVHFPVRFESSAREAEWLGSIMDAIGGYDAEVLTKAAQKIIDTRTDRRFPLPAEIRKVCQELAEEARLAKLPIDTADAPPRFASYRHKLADELIMTDMGRQAARDGWVLGLHHFVVEHGRLPDPQKRKPFGVWDEMPGGGIDKRTLMLTEVEYLRRAAQSFEEYHARCEGSRLPLSQELSRLGASMKARGEELAQRVLSGAG